jgi:glycosyltransferase involved in cell wall biosynthesis
MLRLKEKEFGDDVIYFLRFIETEEVSRLFGAADVTVLPYREASQSGVMFMSYAHGVPVLLPELGGFPDDVVPGKTGFLFNPGNPESLCNQIELAMSHFGINNHVLREEIISHTSRKYQWDESANALIKIYQN